MHAIPAEEVAAYTGDHPRGSLGNYGSSSEVVPFDAFRRRSGPLCVVQQGSSSAGGQILRSRAARAGQAETFQRVTSINNSREHKKRQGHKTGELASCKALASIVFLAQRSRIAAAGHTKYILTSSAHCYSTYQGLQLILSGAVGYTQAAT